MLPRARFVLACSASMLGAGAAACVTGGGVESTPQSCTSTPPPSASGTAASLPDDLGPRLDAVSACTAPDGAPATFAAQRVGGATSLVGYFRLDATTSTSRAFDACSPYARPAVGAVRVYADGAGAVDTTNPAIALRLYVDICGLEPIRAESGSYEAWLVHDLVVPTVAGADRDGHAAFARITADDARAIARAGDGQNVPGSVFTTDGRAPRASDADASGNTLAVFVSAGAFNALEGHDAHAFVRFAPGTSWSPPPYEWLASGGAIAPYASGAEYSACADSRVPGSGPSGVLHGDRDGHVVFGDDPIKPRDPDRSLLACGASMERRMRGVPSGLAREILLDAFVRPSSFEPKVYDVSQRLVDAYAFEVARFDANEDGVLDASEVDVTAAPRLYLSIAELSRALVTREIDDGLLSPRFAPTIAPAVVLTGGASFAAAPKLDAGTRTTGDGGASDPGDNVPKNGPSRRPM